MLVAGRLRDTVDLGAGAVTTVGGNDAFVASYASDGAVRWARAIGSTSLDWGGGGGGAPASGLVLVGADPATGATQWVEAPGNTTFATIGLVFAAPGELRIAAEMASNWMVGGTSATRIGTRDAVIGAFHVGAP